MRLNMAQEVAARNDPSFLPLYNVEKGYQRKTRCENE